MRRVVAISALFGLALAALTAAGQKVEKVDDPPAKKPADKAAGKKADPAEAAIAAALAHDPDVRMARAKVQLAEAELAKARQAVTVKVINLRATIEEQKQVVALAQEEYTRTEAVRMRGGATAAELIQARIKLETARSALARTEMELKLVTGDGAAGGVGAGPKAGDPDAVARGLEFLAIQQRAGQHPAALDNTWFIIDALRAAGAVAEVNVVRGAVPDRIRAALDKKVTLGAKGQKVPLDKALEVFKTEAGLDVPVRGVGDLVNTPVITSQGEEMPVGAWLQLYQDYSNDGRFYVREYGLLFTHKSTAPPDALTLTQFWDLKPAAKPAFGPRVVGKYRGVEFAADADGAAELVRAVAKLAAAYETYGTTNSREAWDRDAPKDYLRFEVTDLRDLRGFPGVPGGDGQKVPAEVRVRLSNFPDEITAVEVKAEDGVRYYMKPKPEAVKEFATKGEPLLK